MGAKVTIELITREACARALGRPQITMEIDLLMAKVVACHELLHEADKRIHLGSRGAAEAA